MAQSLRDAIAAAGARAYTLEHRLADEGEDRLPSEPGLSAPWVVVGLVPAHDAVRLRYVPSSARAIVVAPGASVADMIHLFADDRVDLVLSADWEAPLRQVLQLIAAGRGAVNVCVPPDDAVTVTCVDFAGRSTVLAQLEAFAEASGMRRQQRAALIAASEELLMNALYDAPIDAGGVPVFANVEPRARVEQASPSPVVLRYGARDDQVIVSVRDRYGRFTKATLATYLQRCASSAQQLEQKHLGAGLGLYVIVHAASAVSVRVVPGAVTEVACAFDITGKRGLRVLGFETVGGVP